MNKQEMKKFINNVNCLTNINSKLYREVYLFVHQNANINNPEHLEIIKLAKEKGI